MDKDLFKQVEKLIKEDKQLDSERKNNLCCAIQALMNRGV